MYVLYACKSMSIWDVILQEKSRWLLWDSFLSLWIHHVCWVHKVCWPRDLPAFAFPAVGFQQERLLLAFFCECSGMNSGPYAWVASTFPTELFLKPLIFQWAFLLGTLMPWLTDGCHFPAWGWWKFCGTWHLSNPLRKLGHSWWWWG